MKDFTPCEHGSHPMGCIQCQLAVQPPATPQEPEQAQTLNDVFDVFETWARRKGATDTSSVSLGFWAFNEFHAIIGQPLRDWLRSRRASTPSPVEPTPEPETDLIGLVLNLQAYAREHGWQDCDEPIAALLAWRRIEPTPAPETCEWRYSADAEWWQSGCDSQDLSGDERLVGPDEKAKFCPYCGAKLVGR